MKEHTFVMVKATKNFYRFQELSPTGHLLDKGDEAATFNFGCIYLPAKSFKSQPKEIKLHVEATYEEG